MKLIDRVIAYRDNRFPMGSDCACRIRIWQLKDGLNVILATELDEPPGASVTNTAERWAEKVCFEYSLNPFRTIFIENYDRRRNGVDPCFPRETFDFISFKWENDRASKPEWKHAGRAAVERLIGEDLP